MSKDVTPVAANLNEMIDAFGGEKALADWADVGPSAVSNWKAVGAIPRGYHFRLARELDRRGIKYAESIFDAECVWTFGQRHKRSQSVAAE